MKNMKPLKMSNMAESVGWAIANAASGWDVLKRPKFAKIIEKTLVYRFVGSKNGKVIYLNKYGDVVSIAPKTFNCNAFNPPLLGKISEEEITLEDFANLFKEN